VNKANKHDQTPLYIASYYGHLEVIKALLGAEADVNKTANNGQTPLYLASYQGHVKVVQALLGVGAEVDKADNLGRTPVISASSKGHLEMVKILLAAKADVNKADKGGGTPLHKASFYGHVEVVQTLLGAGAEVDKTDNFGDTPLHFVCQNANNSEKYLELVKILLSAGVNVNIRNKNGYTPVYYVSKKGDYEKIVSLLTHILVEEYEKTYKLEDAIRDGVEEEWQRAVERQGAAEVVVKGPSYTVTTEDESGETKEKLVEGKKLPLGFGSRKGPIGKFLGGKRKTKKSKAKKGSKKRITRRTRIKKGGMYDEDHDEYPDVKLSDRQYHINLLIGAIESEVTSFNDDDKKVERVQKIINNFRTKRAKEALVNTSLGYSANTKALHAAALRGDRFNGNMIKLLLNNGARVDSQDIWRQTPLHYAARRGPAINSRILVEEGGADIGAKDRDGKTPLDIAKKEGNSSVERYLEGLLKEREEAKLSEEKEKGMDDEQPTMKMDEIQHHRLRLMNTMRTVLDYKFTMNLKVGNVRSVLDSLRTPANRKAVLNTNSDGSQLPLHAAALFGNGEMVRLLLDNGADANAINHNGETPLHYAAKYAEDFTNENARILVEEGGADIDAKNMDGRTPLDIAKEEGKKIVETYLEGVLKERGRGYANRFRLRVEPSQIEETIKSAIDSRHSRPARAYRARKDDDVNEDINKLGFTPKPPGNRGGKRKTKKSKKTKKNKKTKRKGRK
jgi:ankyrin repeat protein